jgi:hypothetical protein
LFFFIKCFFVLYKIYKFEAVWKKERSKFFGGEYDTPEYDIWLGCNISIRVGNMFVKIGNFMFYGDDEMDRPVSYEDVFEDLSQEIKWNREFYHIFRNYQINQQNIVCKVIKYENNILSFSSVIMSSEEERWDKLQFEEVPNDSVSIEIEINDDNVDKTCLELINLGKQFDAILQS